jgi:3-hydroxybutyryl-CoA dehydratase
MSNIKMWSHYVEGLHIEWPFSFSIENMKSFAKLSSDYNPIHIDAEFAKAKGFEKPLVYGLLLSSQMSRLIGQELPDKNAILTDIQMDFVFPCFPDDQLIFRAELINKSEATYALEFKCHISKDGKTMCSGMVNAIWRP